MSSSDVFSLVLSVLGVYGIVYSLRLFLPRNVVPLVLTSLDEAVALLEHAGNIPNVNHYRTSLAILRNQFIQMRTESHRSPMFWQQLYLLFLCGLTWRLYRLKTRVDAIRRNIELAVDERQLALHTNVNAQNATTTTTALPSSAAGTDLGIHMVNVVEPNLPSQAVLSVLNAA